jgi:phage terminase small subunit
MNDTAQAGLKAMPKHNGGNNKGGNKPKLRLPVYMPDSSLGASNVVAWPQGDIGKLTIKQEAFAQAMASGLYPNQAAAYRVAYDAETMAPGTIYQEASRLMADPRIAARVDEIKGIKQAGERLNSAQIKAHVIARLHIESLDPDSSPASRIRALELLGKLGGVAAFEKQAEDNSLPPDADSVTKALRDRLEALAKASA